MTIAYFATFHHPTRPETRISAADQVRVQDIVATTPGLTRGLVFTPEKVSRPYDDDGPVPPLALELYFADIATCEAALAPAGHLQALAAPNALPSVASATPVQQAMIARAFPVPQPEFQTPPNEPHCTFLVHYPGRAEDLNAWLHYYIVNHPPLMAKFPGIRQIEICTRIDWVGFLPWPRVDYMQRNKVVFDSVAALDAALNSPVRDEMRADYHKFPPFAGSNRHYPFATRVVLPRSRGLT